MAVNPFDAAAASAGVLATQTGRDHHDVAVVLGSGWLPAADVLGVAGNGNGNGNGNGEGAALEVSFTDLGWPPTTVAGHVGAVRSIRAAGHNVLVFLGRIHAYEGNSPATIVHGVRMACAAGCRTIILTNAAGGINDAYRVGQPVLIRDHLNLTATSPLAGPPPPGGYGPRFVDLTDLYSSRLRELAHEEDPSLAEGVYAALPGPHYETPAEVAMLRSLGADLVGMSTALEAIAARHLGAEVLGISLVTNAAAGVAEGGVNHEEVIAAGAAAAASVGALLGALIARLP